MTNLTAKIELLIILSRFVALIGSSKMSLTNTIKIITIKFMDKLTDLLRN